MGKISQNRRGLTALKIALLTVLEVAVIYGMALNASGNQYIVYIVFFAGIIIAVFIPTFIFFPQRRLIALKIVLFIALEAVVIYGGLWALLFAVFSGSTFYITLAFLFTGITILAVPVFIFSRRIKRTALKIYIGALAVLLLVLTGKATYTALDARVPLVMESRINLEDVKPFSDNVSRLPQSASIIISENIPVMDGALALYPLYSAFATAIYPRKDYPPEDFELYLASGEGDEAGETVFDHEVHFTNTVNAFEGLLDGRVDIFFMADLSDKQKKQAEEAGIELVCTPIGREAFVFFVNSSNPIDSLTVEQIQDIYEGKISNWSDLGGSGRIKAFQRNEGSGSQSALQRFMAGRELMKPPTSEYAGGMGEIIVAVSDYKNYKGAIGFSFRYFAAEMVKNSEIKLLKINGIAPIEENVANGEYPIASNFYAITRKDNANPNVPIVLDWLVSEEGQYLVRAVGYTPIK
ncbi:MAG: substrate-binding domain-containing protein [Deferribacteraceae bacterium]|jgi:phosphate transport system substrate-binding protein|nr:substrate-binding domain-containing protein [Deferribacteraceae bacterium]